MPPAETLFSVARIEHALHAGLLSVHDAKACAEGQGMPAGWWYKPDFIINDININSAVTSPAHDEVITLAEGNSHVSIAGYAYSGAYLCRIVTEHTTTSFHNLPIVPQCMLGAFINSYVKEEVSDGGAKHTLQSTIVPSCKGSAYSLPRGDCMGHCMQSTWCCCLNPRWMSCRGWQEDHPVRGVAGRRQVVAAGGHPQSMCAQCVREALGVGTLGAQNPYL